MSTCIEKPIYLGQSLQGSLGTVLSREVLPSGVVITQAALASITYTIWDEAGTSKATGTVTIATAVKDTPPAADPRWSYTGADKAGPNFIHEIPGSELNFVGEARIFYTYTDTSTPAKTWKSSFRLELVEAP